MQASLKRFFAAGLVVCFPAVFIHALEIVGFVVCWLIGAAIIGMIASTFGPMQEHYEAAKPGHCRCGYDLRGTPDRCPECGREIFGDE